MTEKVKIIPLGGLGEVGRNMTAIEYKSKILIIDCGVLFPWEEHPGVDLILPDFTCLQSKISKIEAIILTHGHEDHIGALPYFLRDRSDIPLVGSRFTLLLAKKKLEMFHISPKTIQVDGDSSIKLGDFVCDFVNVAHSIPEALGVFIQTPAAKILHTGDVKLDQTPVDKKPTDLVKFAKFGEKGIDLLLIDSTNSDLPGFLPSETKVREKLENNFLNAKNKIIVTTFASQIHRIQQIINAAKKINRKVVFVGRSMIRNANIAHDEGYLEYDSSDIVSIKRVKELDASKLVFIVTGSQGEPAAVLSKIANKLHPIIEIENNDMVIFSSSIIPGNERGIFKTINLLVKQGAKVITNRQDLVHVSGHGLAGELAVLLNLTKPKNLMPVHGEFRHIQATYELGKATGLTKKNIVCAENGSVVEIRNAEVKIKDKLTLQQIYVDANTVGELDEEDLKERSVLENEGIIMINVVISRKNSNILGEVLINTRGIPEGDLVFNTIKDDIVYGVQDALLKNSEISEPELIKIVKRIIGPWVANQLKRQAMLVPIIAFVD